MKYTEFKELERIAIDSRNLTAFSVIKPLQQQVNKKIENYKYKYRDLDEEQMKILYKLNNLIYPNDNIIGDKIVRILCDIETKKLKMVETEVIDIFKVFNDIQLIKENNFN